MSLFLKRNKGFSLIELVVSMAIFIVIFSLSMASHREGENSSVFRLEAFNIEDVIKSVQNMAITGREIDGSIPDAYGIFFHNNRSDFIVYGDLNDDNSFTEGLDSIYSEGSLNDKIHFNKYVSFCQGENTTNRLDISFVPPQPLAIINNNDVCSSTIISMISDATNGNWQVHLDVITGRVWTEFIQ